MLLFFLKTIALLIWSALMLALLHRARRPLSLAPQYFILDLSASENSERQVRSIRRQLSPRDTLVLRVSEPAAARPPLSCLLAGLERRNPAILIEKTNLSTGVL